MALNKDPKTMEEAAQIMMDTIEGLEILAQSFRRTSTFRDGEDGILRLAEAAEPILTILQAATRGPKEAMAILGYLFLFIWEQHGGKLIEQLAKGEASE